MSISITFARAVVAELQERGLDGSELLRRSEIDPARLGDICDCLQPEESERLMTAAVSMTGDPALGLAVGGRSSGCAFQVFGQLLRAQRTFREAFAMHLRFGSLVARGPSWSLVEEDDLAYLTVNAPLRSASLRRFMMDFGITAWARLCTPFLPRPTEAQPTAIREVRFQHQAPSYVDKYQTYFKCPVSFGQQTNAIVLPREALDREQPHADATIARMLEESAERLLQAQSHEDRLHRRIRVYLRYGIDLQNVRSEHVASHFGMSVRTLRRRLALEGHSLSTLIEEVRCQLACDALRRTDVSLPRVAELAGFSEASAFFRAFKRWTGRTPGEYRRNALAQASEQEGAASA